MPDQDPFLTDPPFEGHRILATTAPHAAVLHRRGDRWTLSGSGRLWGGDARFHYVWKKVSGDFALAASLPEGSPAGSAGLMIRESLQVACSAAAAYLLPGGRPVLQTCDTPGAETRELLAGSTGHRRIRIERRGSYISMSTAADDGTWAPTGGSILLPFKGSFYLGVAAWECGEGATLGFSAPEFFELSPGSDRLVCALEVMELDTLRRRVVYQTDQHIEAPNWSRDGASLVFNGGGRLFRIGQGGGAPRPIDTGFAVRCNNDHGLSPDGSLLAISDHSEEGHSLIYVLPSSGGAPRRVTRPGPSYWHGWSPDGSTLAYCAQRDGVFGIFTIPAAGGDERRVTTAAAGGLDDGPDYSPDGRWIYFNSDRTGRMQIWRVHPDGKGLEQVTFDAYNNWFAHPSPDGRHLVLLSYEPDVAGHPPNKDVRLRLLPSAGGEPRVLACFFGGQGTINVPSWSPDSKQFAYVTYQLFPKA